ncbi:unnamed protein product, partial [Oncorhynchus mykiss]
YLPADSLTSIPVPPRLSLKPEFGFNEHHQNDAINYMRFACSKRAIRLKTIDSCFEDLKDNRLVDETFTVDEVLDGLKLVVRGEVETELVNTAHTNVLLLRQLFSQAEKFYLRLQTDISELENRELLEQVAELNLKTKIRLTRKLALLNKVKNSTLLRYPGYKRKMINSRAGSKLWKPWPWVCWIRRLRRRGLSKTYRRSKGNRRWPPVLRRSLVLRTRWQRCLPERPAGQPGLCQTQPAQGTRTAGPSREGAG